MTTPSHLPESGDPRAFYVLDLHAFVWRHVTGARQRAPDAFAGWLGRLMREQGLSTESVVAADDSKGETFRHVILREAGKLDGDAYKGDRKQVDPGLYAIYERSRALIAEMLSDVGIAVYRAPGFEADDVIATIAYRTAGIEEMVCAACRWQPGLDDYFDAVDFVNGSVCPACEQPAPAKRCGGKRVVVVGGDRDLLALVGPRDSGGSVTVYDGYRRVYADDADVRRKMGVGPAQIVDFWALVGGKNNVPGVKLIGPEAAKLILLQRTLAEALAAIEDVDREPRAENDKAKILGLPVKMIAKLRVGASDARLSRRLTELRMDAPIVRDPS